MDVLFVELLILFCKIWNILLLAYILSFDNFILFVTIVSNNPNSSISSDCYYSSLPIHLPNIVVISTFFTYV